MKRTNHNKRTAVLSISLGILLFGSAEQIYCMPLDDSRQAKTTIINARVQKRNSLKNTQNPEFKAERLKNALQLPDVPAYSGKGVEFVTGTTFPQVKGGPSITEQFTVKDAPKTVLDWYKKVLSANQWVPLDNMTGNGLAVMKANNLCQVMIVAPTKPTSQCDVLVRYKFYKPHSS